MCLLKTIGRSVLFKLSSHKQSVSCEYVMCLLKTYFFFSFDNYNILKNTTCILCRKTLMPTSSMKLHLSIHISPEYVLPAVNMIIALELLKVMSNNIGPKYFNCTLCDTRVHTNNINKFNIWESKNKISSSKTTSIFTNSHVSLSESFDLSTTPCSL